MNQKSWLVAAILLGSTLVGTSSASAVTVIVEATPGGLADARDAVIDRGGEIELELGIIDGFSATIDERDLDALRDEASIAAVTFDRAISLHGHGHGTSRGNDDDDDDAGERDGDDGNSLAQIARVTNADDLWRRGFTGEGVDIALIDSGIAPVRGLTRDDKVVNGPDLSFDQGQDNLRYLDLYGHGTHMAGIIAGRDRSRLTDDTFNGIAPGARLLNVKVANGMGAADVSQVIAAIDWVVQHRTDNGLNIRILNLSFGTDSTQDPTIDPLAHAVEVAWHNGIFVSTATGNRGDLGLTQPALDPWVLAVGAFDTNGNNGRGDDTIPAWSGRGNGVRDPDLVAPGVSIQSLRVPGSYLDVTFPGARSGDRFFRGTGTSQATAVLSGAAALLLEQRPELTPDQLKALLTSTADPLRRVGSTAQGAGAIDLKDAARSPTPDAVQTFPISQGTGSLEASRGSLHVVDGDGVALEGEIDIFGNEWTGDAWALAAQAGTSWSGGEWMGTSWSGSCWCGTSWSGTSWSGTSWSGTSWSGTSWSGTSWSNASWSGTSWSSIEFPSFGTSWSGTSWSDTSWSGTSWSTERWE